MNSMKTDPSFAAVMKIPEAQEVLAPKVLETAEQ
jgi:hypothetical protein